MCAFCNQRTITGTEKIPHGEDVKRICTQAMNEVSDPQDTEIAFFGGSFTAVPRDYMTELLEAAKPFVGCGKFKGIRLSTRPDYIDEQVLQILKSCGVTSIELGAQSMCDKVLKANERGHTSADVKKASRLIKSFGFELGLQMMVGLYQSSWDDEISTMEQIIELAPKTVRIYPVAVLSGTRLADLYNSGDYKLLSMDNVIDLCGIMMKRFNNAGIKIIRMGLHSSETVEKNIVAGFYHPAFSELVSSRIFLNAMLCYCEKNSVSEIRVCANPSSASFVSGHKKCNKILLQEKGIALKVIPDPTLTKNQIRINEDVINVFEIA